ncbi:MAG: RadC family protein [Janthinobacterium lividum]
MSISAVTDDGPPATETLTTRAEPRLWMPENEPPPEPPAAAQATRRKPKTPPDPETALVVRDRYSPAIKDLPSDERPRERLHAYGAQALTTAELIAILIQTGNAQRSAVSLGEFLLAEFGSIKGVATASLEQLAGVKGLGAAKASQIKAAIEFGNRLTLFSEEGRPSIGGPRDVSNLLMPDLRFQKKEHLMSLLLNTKNQVLAIKTVSVGDLSSSIVHPREVYKDAVIASAAAIIVAHNHPSGDPTPSAEDVAVTKRLVQSGEIMGIDLLDHIVLGDGTFVSLKERGLI